MRRSEMLSGLLLAMAIIGGGLLALSGWLRSDKNQPPLPAAPTKVLTAKTAYEVARPEAQNWSPDAQLVTAQANWPAGSSFHEADANWGFVFYAPSRQETALVSVVAGQGKLLNIRPVTAPPTIIAAPAGWQTDSTTIIAHILSNGGQQFIEQQGQISLSLTLLANEAQPIWQAQLINPQTKATWTIRLSAITGDILNTLYTAQISQLVSKTNRLAHSS